MKFLYECLKRKYKRANISPIRFPRELTENWLSEREGLQGIFGVGTIECE